MVSNGKTGSTGSSGANGQNAEIWSLGKPEPQMLMLWVESEKELERKMFVLEDMFLRPAFMDLRSSSMEPRRLSGVMGVHDRVEPWTGYLGSSVSFSMDWLEDETDAKYGNPWKEGMWTFSEVETFRSVIEKEMMERGMKSPEIPMVIWEGVSSRCGSLRERRRARNIRWNAGGE